MKITESQLQKMIAEAINEYHIKNANGNYTKYNFSDYARTGGGIRGQTFGNIHNNPRDFYSRKYTNKQNALNPEEFRGQEGQETWVYRMIQRENKLRKSLGQELGALDRKIKGYVRKGYFGKDPDIVNLVNVYSAFLHYTSRKYEYFIAQYRNRNQQSMSNVDYGNVDSLEEAQSIYGLNTENGTSWITDLEQQIRGLIDEGVFRGKRTMEINNDFLELLRLGRLGKPTVAQAQQTQSQQVQADNAPNVPTQPGEEKEGINTGDKYADNVGNDFEDVQPEEGSEGVATGFNDPNVIGQVKGAKDEYSAQQAQQGGGNRKKRKFLMGALIGLLLTVGAALGLKGCEGNGNTVVPPATDDTDLQTQAPETQTIEVNFDNGSAQLSQEDIVKLQNLPKDQYNVVVKGNQYQWHMNGRPCDPATNQRLQQNLDNQRAETIRQYLPSANITITNPAGTQANATINGGGTIDFGAAQNMQQQAQGQTMQINENDIVRIVAECVKKIKEAHKVLDPDDAAAEYKDTPYGAELARRAKNAKPYVKEAKKGYTHSGDEYNGADPDDPFYGSYKAAKKAYDKKSPYAKDLHKQYKDGKEMKKDALSRAVDKAVAECIKKMFE